MLKFQFDSFAEFLQMDGDAVYVWSVYILFALFLVINVVPALLKHRQIIKQYRARFKRESSKP